MIFKVGLTGGIASGKSEAAGEFAALGAAVIDMDTLAREIARPGTPGLDAIVRTFGEGILRQDGTLDRRALRHRIFSDPEARKTLEGITHPRITERLHEKLDAITGVPYAVIEIPLLAGTGLEGELDRILLIEAPQQERIKRLMLRDNETIENAGKAIDSQASRAVPRKMADDIIINSGDRGQLARAVRELHGSYLQMAGADKENHRR